MPEFSTEAKITIAAPLVRAFEHIVPINLPLIFKGFGPLPAVSGTRDQTGNWDHAGQTRTVLLSDGSTAQEQLTAYEHPKRFAYTVSRFSGILRFLATEAHGEWWFERGAAADSTFVRWKYAFVARSRVAAPLVWLIAHTLWHCYMGKALALSKREVERAA